MQTLNASLSTTLTGTHFLVTRDQVSFFLFCLGMGDCFNSILQESFFWRFACYTVQFLLGILVRDFRKFNDL